MAEVSLNWCAVLLLLAMASKSAVFSATDISYHIGELNNKLSKLLERRNRFDANTEENVPVLLHGEETKDLKSVDDVTVHMNVTNRKLANLEDKIESKFNALAATVTSNMSSLLHQVEEKVSKGAENEKLQNQETNAKLDNLVAKVGSFATLDTRFTDLESKLNALAATVTNFVENIEATLLKPLSSCADAFARPLFNRDSGVYNIQPIANSSAFKAYCMADPKEGLPWTVVQRRVDGSVDFYRNWTEYQRGFGDLEGNLWIGLDRLHLLTTKGEPQELWVMLTDRDGKSVHAYYDRFAIGNETEKYPLEVLGEYSGDAGDSLTYHKSMKFTTYDNDNDRDNRNCAKLWKSAGWLNWDCGYSDLNGLYESDTSGVGLYWDGFSVQKYAHMAIRPTRK